MAIKQVQNKKIGNKEWLNVHHYAASLKVAKEVKNKTE